MLSSMKPSSKCCTPPARANETDPVDPAAMKPDHLPPQPDGSTPVPVRRWRQGQWHEAQDQVAQERPVALEYNGLSHAVMLATPDNLAGLTLRIEVASACFARFKDQRRSLAGRTGCGLCGAENLAQAVRQVKPVGGTARFSPQALSRGMGQLRAHQPLLSATGATHAAGWCDASGQLHLAREDVGRHNALDKLIGALLRPGQPLQAQAGSGFIVVTSRASHEMAQKAAAAGVPLLAAVSGVTELAVHTAQASGLSLLGFARGEDFSIYTHAQRVILEA